MSSLQRLLVHAEVIGPGARMVNSAVAVAVALARWLRAQLGEPPAASILKVMEKKLIAEIDVKTVIMADLSGA
jgi:hypothetical protein